jgi:predicted MFS family arabinose efflux permease
MAYSLNDDSSRASTGYAVAYLKRVTNRLSNSKKMRANNHHSSFATLLLLAIGLPGFIGILVVQATVNPYRPDALTSNLQAANTSTWTPAFTETSPALPSLTSTSLPILNLTAPPIASSLSLHAFIRAPNGPVAQLL